MVAERRELSHKLTLTRSFPKAGPDRQDGRRVATSLQGIDPNGQSDYTFDTDRFSKTARREKRATTTSARSTCTASSARIRLIGAFDVSQAATTQSRSTAAAPTASSTTGAPPPMSPVRRRRHPPQRRHPPPHRSIHIDDPYNGPTPEHNNGIQAQTGAGLHRPQRSPQTPPTAPAPTSTPPACSSTPKAAPEPHDRRPPNPLAARTRHPSPRRHGTTILKNLHHHRLRHLQQLTPHHPRSQHHRPTLRPHRHLPASYVYFNNTLAERPDHVALAPKYPSFGSCQAQG